MIQPFRSAFPGGIDDAYVPTIVRPDDRRERARGSLCASDPKHADHGAGQASRAGQAGRAGGESGRSSGLAAGAVSCRQPGRLPSDGRVTYGVSRGVAGRR